VTELVVHSGLQAQSGDKSIVYISDLHFDYIKYKRRASAAPPIKDAFIAHIKEHYADAVICLTGDFFDNYRKTLAFAKELEANQVVGFFVLGNHDYWNNQTKSHLDIIRLFVDATKKNRYFHFLCTGKKHYIGDLCFIGDTGWTSFRRNQRKVIMKQFMSLPDADKVKDFSPKGIIALHDKWIAYANSVLAQEERVIVLTHFPMVNFTQNDGDCWWSSTTALTGDSCWRIFGHTHVEKEQQDYNISSQRGYGNKSAEDLQKKFERYQFHAQSLKDLEERDPKQYNNRREAFSRYLESDYLHTYQYSPRDFGMLEPTMQFGLATTSQGCISRYYSPQIILNSTTERETVSDIQRRGYKRCAANKVNFAALAKSPTEYLERVKSITNGYLSNFRIGYMLSSVLPREVVQAIFSSIAFLERGEYSDVRTFITAAIITGYAYNRMPFLIRSMRPLDDYDIIRFWMMFQTIKKLGLDIDEFSTVRKGNRNDKYISFCNVDVYLPEIDGYSLSVNEMQALMQRTPLLPPPAALLE